MRRLSLSSLALLSVLGLAGCGDDEPIEPLADFRYTLGCGGRSGCRVPVLLLRALQWYLTLTAAVCAGSERHVHAAVRQQGW